MKFKNKLYMEIEKLIPNEIQFCEEIDCERNENHQFIYESTNHISKINLPFILKEYKDWLIENKLITCVSI